MSAASIFMSPEAGLVVSSRGQTRLDWGRCAAAGVAVVRRRASLVEFVLWKDTLAAPEMQPWLIAHI